MRELTSPVQANQAKPPKADGRGLSEDLQAHMTIMEMEFAQLQELYLEPGGSQQFLLAQIETVCLYSLSFLWHLFNSGLQQDILNQVRGMQSVDDPEFQRVAKGHDQQKPIVIVQQGNKWYMADGHHCAEAACMAGDDSCAHVEVDHPASCNQLLCFALQCE
jgi:hypothetical protein